MVSIETVLAFVKRKRKKKGVVIFKHYTWDALLRFQLTIAGGYHKCGGCEVSGESDDTRLIGKEKTIILVCMVPSRARRWVRWRKADGSFKIWQSHEACYP